MVREPPLLAVTRNTDAFPPLVSTPTKEFTVSALAGRDVVRVRKAESSDAGTDAISCWASEYPLEPVPRAARLPPFAVFWKVMVVPFHKKSPAGPEAVAPLSRS